jgi:hypothetical protein
VVEDWSGADVVTGAGGATRAGVSAPFPLQPTRIVTATNGEHLDHLTQNLRRA